MFKKTLLLAASAALALAFASSGAMADPARALGYVAGHHDHLDSVKKGGKGPKHFGKRGRAFALTRGRGKKIGLRRRLR